MKNFKTYIIQMFTYAKGSAISLQSISFSANRVPKTVMENSFGEEHIFDKVSHYAVSHNKQSFTFIKNWFSKI
jgi:hypothetical protein